MSQASCPLRGQTLGWAARLLQVQEAARLVGEAIEAARRGECSWRQAEVDLADTLEQWGADAYPVIEAAQVRLGLTDQGQRGGIDAERLWFRACRQLTWPGDLVAVSGAVERVALRMMLAETTDRRASAAANLHARMEVLHARVREHAPRLPPALRGVEWIWSPGQARGPAEDFVLRPGNWPDETVSTIHPRARPLYLARANAA